MSYAASSLATPETERMVRREVDEREGSCVADYEENLRCLYCDYFDGTDPSDRPDKSQWINVHKLVVMDQLSLRRLQELTSSGLFP